MKRLLLFLTCWVLWGSAVLNAQINTYYDVSLSLIAPPEYLPGGSTDLQVKMYLKQNNPVPKCYAGTAVSSSGKTLVHDYKIYASTDGVSFFNYATWPPNNPNSSGDYIAKLHEQIRFDGQPMFGGDIYKQSTIGQPVYYRYKSNSDTVYKPGQVIEIDLYQQTNTNMYYRVEIWHYDPADSAATLCVSKSQTVRCYTRLLPPLNSPGQAQVFNRVDNPNNRSNIDSNNVQLRIEVNKTPAKSFTLLNVTKNIYQLRGDTAKGQSLKINILNLTIPGFGGSGSGGAAQFSTPRNTPASQTTLSYKALIGYNTGNFFYSPRPAYKDSIVVGKPYLYLLEDAQNGNELINYNSTCQGWRFCPYGDHMTKKYDYLYVPVIAPRFSMISSSVKSGLKLEWDNVAAVSGLNSLKIIAQNVYNASAWRTVATLNKTDLSYTDVDAIPGERYIYRLQLISSSGSVLEETFCFGDMPANGKIEGKLISKFGAPMANRRVYAYAIIDGNLSVKEGTTDNTGFFSLDNLRYGENGASYTIKPYEYGHAYDPEATVRTISVLGNYVNNVQIKDTTIFTLTGKLLMNNSKCPVKDINLMLNGKRSVFKTDKYGNYAVGIEEPGTYTLAIDTSMPGAVKGHIMSPASYTLVVGSKKLTENLNFNDISTNLLKIKAHTNCGKPFADSARVRITSVANDAICFDRIVTVYNDGSNMNLNLVLPKQKYTVELVETFPVNTELVESMEPISIDLNNDTLPSARMAEFNYVGPSQIVEVKGFGDKVCLGSDSTYTVKQFSTYPITYAVREIHSYYASHSCPTDTGRLVIYDNISDSTNAIKVPVKNGVAKYTLHPSTPNFIANGKHPYQKNITATFESLDTSYVSDVNNTWAMVEGHKPRTRAFVTKTPELPFFILHDPPGSASYSYLEKGSELSQTFTNSVAVGGSLGGFLNLRVGAEFPVPFTGVVFGGGVMVDFSMSGGQTRTGESVSTTLTVENQRFATSSNPDFVGKDGDVVVGASLNMIYALTDILKYDPKICNADRDTSFVWGEKGFNTTYAYTVKHIRNTLVPELKVLKSIQKNSDSAKLLQTYIDVWEQILKQNDSAVARAQVVENKSFSSGVEYEYSKTTSNISSVSVSYESFLDIEAMVGLRIGEASKFNETEFGITTTFNWTATNTSTTDKTDTRTVGYVFNDDDVGDNYSIDVTEDKSWGTIGFRTVAGVSSCPHEVNTQKRYAVGLDVEEAVKYNVPADGSAVYNLRVYDRGETNSPIPNKTFLISMNPNSNLDGAIVSIAGNTISPSAPYVVNIPWGSSINLPLVIQRGPLAYDYNDIEIVALTACDIDNGNVSSGDNYNSDIVDMVKLSAHFQTECQSVEIVRPWNGEIATEDLQPLSYTGFDVNDKNLQSVTLQVKKDRDKYWSNIKTTKLTDLTGKYFDYSLDVTDYDNGYYFVRAMSTCANGRSYSEVVSLEVDHTDYSNVGGVVLATEIPPVRLMKTFPDDDVMGDKDTIAALYTGEMLVLDGRTVAELINVSNNQKIVCKASADHSRIVFDLDRKLLPALDGQTLEARLVNAIDTAGNTISRDLRWRFKVDLAELNWKKHLVIGEAEFGKIGTLVGTLENKGTQATNYEIQLPYWLICDNMTGTVSKGGTQDLQFYSSSTLKPGNYTGVITLINKDNGRKTLLKATLTVKHKQPEIAIVNSNGKLYTQLKLQFADPSIKVADILSVDSNDVIYVYSKDTCRGMAKITYESDLGKWAAPALVQGQQNEKLTFKFWDASKGILFDARESSYVSNGAKIGSWNYPLVLTVADTSKISGNSSIDHPQTELIGNWVYPNPNAGQFHLNLTKLNLTENTELLIVDLQGRIVHTIQLDSNGTPSIHLPDLKEGVYIFKLTGGGAEGLFKPARIIIQH